MASRQEASEIRPAPRLYLVTETVDDAGAMVRALESALGAADVAAVLLSVPRRGENDLVKLIKAVAPAVQGRDAALLLQGHPELAGRAGADGVHFAGVEALQAAISSLQPARIAGAGGLVTRHDAMQAAEAGADYVMFGEPDAAGRQLDFHTVVERVAWWSEVFQVPCVAFAADLDQVTTLAEAGADFVAIGGFVWDYADGAAAAVAAAAERLHRVELV
jgi:thiamine-phosphate pyrophosphorylase